MSWQEGLALLETLEVPTVSDYNRVLRACAREGQHEPGLWLLEEMSELGLTPDRTSYVLAIESCASKGQFEDANHVLSCMKDAGK